MKAKVLWWKYGDGSGMGIERVYINSDQRSADDYDLAQNDSQRFWQLDEVPLFIESRKRKNGLSKKVHSQQD